MGWAILSFLQVCYTSTVEGLKLTTLAAANIFNLILYRTTDLSSQVSPSEEKKRSPPDIIVVVRGVWPSVTDNVTLLSCLQCFRSLRRDLDNEPKDRNTSERYVQLRDSSKPRQYRTNLRMLVIDAAVGRLQSQNYLHFSMFTLPNRGKHQYENNHPENPNEFSFIADLRESAQLDSLTFRVEPGSPALASRGSMPETDHRGSAASPPV